ncbi:glycoside hydrolase family 16 protein [Lentithecium fluviatile CBS 122367]|uniref:Glycoside hydrolase family 16 protein n=1 Tax=Lentithecium fluviatile CBS 122367 TaxID=1168545 RepID=A0A6G1IPK7_9PLEO|nr:glycoside hydrolase family 16 protein [Lentithecium fluviatile CBS 122367]
MPSSSFLLKAGAVLSALSSTTLAQKYKVQDVYEGKSFLDGFNFLNAPDPTNGYVNYVSKADASKSGLIRMVGSDNYIGVDYASSLSPTGVGRDSVRIEGAKNYNHGLFVVDIKHMPGGICGTWPAFWSLGSGAWPKNGEIDIIEGVNQNNFNKFVLHTDTQCKVNGLGQSGAQASYDCALDGPATTAGCDVNTNGIPAFGTSFNTNGGGMWFFPRGSIPASITADKPDVKDFGTPTANFQGACDMDTRFKNHRFIFDTTFCGDWAGNVYSQSACPQYSGLDSMSSCKKFVAENPSAFKNAYWLIKSFKTYIKDTTASGSSTTHSSTSTRSSSSTHISSTSQSSSSTRSSSSSTHSSSSLTSSHTSVSSSYSSSSSSTPVFTPSASSYSSSTSTPGGSYASESSTPVYSGVSSSPTPTGYGYTILSSPAAYEYEHSSSSSPASYGYEHSSSTPAGYGSDSATSTPCSTSTPVTYGYPSSSPADSEYASSSSSAGYEYPSSSSLAEYGYASAFTPAGYEYPSSSTPQHPLHDLHPGRLHPHDQAHSSLLLLPHHDHYHLHPHLRRHLLNRLHHQDNHPNRRI